MTNNIYDTTTGGALTQTITTGGTWPYPSDGTFYPPVTGYYYHTVTPPVECSGDVHVFPCPHCDKCKCGKATVKREKAKR